MRQTKVVVADYDPRWPHQFETLRATLLGEVSDIALAVEHVGSTSVPGLCAKPIIDIDIIVERENVAKAIARLAAIGYEHQGDLGVTDREAFRNSHEIRHNLYVCVTDTTNVRNHLILRDALRADPALVSEYGALKRALAARYPDDIDSYIAGKSAFIMRILEASGNLSPAELAAIRAINKLPGT